MGVFDFFKGFTKSQDGFSLLETLIIISILGISSAIAIPTYLGFFETYQLNIAQSKVHQAIRQAQLTARHTNTAWRFGIREHSGSIEWSVYKDGASNMHWHTLSKSLKLDQETTLRKSAKGIYSAKFDHKGNAKILGRVTLTGRYYTSSKRCVIVSTLIGTTRRGRGHTKPNSSGRYCY